MIAGIDWMDRADGRDEGRRTGGCLERRPSERVKNRFRRKGSRRVFHFCFHRSGCGARFGGAWSASARARGGGGKMADRSLDKTKSHKINASSSTGPLSNE